MRRRLPPEGSFTMDGLTGMIQLVRGLQLSPERLTRWALPYGGLTPDLVLVLIRCAQPPGRTNGQLVEELGISPAQASRYTTDLLRVDLLYPTCDTGDRRRKPFRTTMKGDRVLLDLVVLVETILTSGWQPLEPDPNQLQLPL